MTGLGGGGGLATGIWTFTTTPCATRSSAVVSQ